MRGWSWLCALLVGYAELGCATHNTYGASVSPESVAGLLPARTRRLSNLEVERSLAALTGLEVKIASELPPDVRQEGYTPNANQDVSASWATRYAALAEELANSAVERNRGALSDCHDAGGEACRRRTVEELGLRAFRRPLSAEELAAFEALLVEGSRAGGFAGSLRLLLRALIEAPSFLYVTELGPPGGSGARIVRLDDYEVASQLSFMLRGGPPDRELLGAAAAGKLQDAATRVGQARRLLSMPDTRQQFRRFALEWLEVDNLLQTAKSSRLFPTYDALKPFMLAETESYVDEVMVHGGASVKSLIGGGFASVGPEMARFYGLKTYGARASLAGTGRLGVLQQASFLAAHAHEDVTSPVKRGDFVMRKLLCEKVKRPAEIGLEVVMPPPSESLTNRERMTRHIADPSCAGCHTTLDAIGYTFETFDAMGGVQTTDRGHPVRSSVKVHLGPGSQGPVELDASAALTQALLDSPVISECFARHAFRYFSAQADPKVEASFMSVREQLPRERRDNLLDVLLAYVESELFVLREARSP